MAWYYNKKRKVKQDIGYVEKLPVGYKVVFKEKCKSCGMQESLTFIPKLHKDPLMEKAINNYINEHHEITVKQSMDLAKKNKDCNRFAVLNKNTLKLDFITRDVH